MSSVLAVFALTLCTLFALPGLSSSERDVCIDADDGTVLYYDANHEMFSEDVVHHADEIGAETMLILVNVTAPSTQNAGNESKMYLLGNSYLCYYVSPELVDLMSFGALKLAKRTQRVSLEVLTFTTCGNKSWENLLLDAFALDKENAFAKSLEATNETYCSIAVRSGLVAFMSLGLSSLFAVFVVLPIFCTITSNRAEYPTSHRPVNRALADMNSLSLGVYTLYLCYLVLCTVSYYFDLDGVSAFWTDQYNITSFTGNALFLYLTVCSAFAGGLCYKCRRPKSSCLIRLSTACTIALTTAILYHAAFLLLVLVEDFVTAFSSILIQGTVLLCIYTLFPASYENYRVSKSTRQICNLWFMLSLLSLVPFLYTMTLFGAKDLLNAGYVYKATKFWFVIVLFATGLAWIFCFVMLISAYRRKDVSLAKGRATKSAKNSLQNGISASEKAPLVTVSKARPSASLHSGNSYVDEHFAAPWYV